MELTGHAVRGGFALGIGQQLPSFAQLCTQCSLLLFLVAGHAPIIRRAVEVDADGRIENPYPSVAYARSVSNMWTVLVILLVVWAVLAVTGFAIKGLLWLAIIGVILFVGTVIFGFVRNRSRKDR